MEGLGNDFVVLDNRARDLVIDAALARRLADRRRGVGCDQLLVAEPPVDGAAQVRMRIFNTDGSEAAQCGNGVRCFSLFVRERGVGGDGDLTVETDGGVVRARPGAHGSVSVDMGVPRFAPQQVPLDPGRVRSRDDGRYSTDIDDETVEFTAVSMGNPHAVLQVSSVQEAAVARIGPALQSSGVFPDGVNVGFAETVTREHIRLRVYERGVGETEACGTGACAAVACGRMLEALEAEVDVDLPGGRLHISWLGAGQPLWMTGPARHVFEGYIDL